MFLGLLNEAQRNSFLALATKLVMADRTIEPEERVMLDLRVAEMGGNAKAPPAEIYGPPNTAVFNSRRARAIVLVELFLLAMSDSKMSDQELPILDQLISAFEFSPTEANDIRTWAEDMAPAIAKGWLLVDGESSEAGR